MNFRLNFNLEKIHLIEISSKFFTNTFYIFDFEIFPNILTKFMISISFCSAIAPKLLTIFKIVTFYVYSKMFHLILYQKCNIWHHLPTFNPFWTVNLCCLLSQQIDDRRCVQLTLNKCFYFHVDWPKITNNLA